MLNVTTGLISEVGNEIAAKRSYMEKGIDDKWKKVGEKGLIVGSIIIDKWKKVGEKGLIVGSIIIIS